MVIGDGVACGVWPDHRRRPSRDVPTVMTDGGSATWKPWQPDGGTGDAVDRAVLATRRAVFPLLGLDPHDPRD